MKRKKVIVGIVVILCLTIFYLVRTREDTTEYEEAVHRIAEADCNEAQEAVNNLVEEGKMRIHYQTGAVFNGCVSESFQLKNHKENHGSIVFQIFDKVGTVLYQSKMIRPGYEIKNIQLKRELPRGIYDCNIKIGYADAEHVASVFPITIQVK